MATEAEKDNAKAGGYNVLFTWFGTDESYVVYWKDKPVSERYGSESAAWDDAVGKRWREQHER
ncbi:hypothetical protein [Pseudomonas mandelii]|uniref:hypothetical protein n=1 Tax=Pseudomonas mandelii TaxID=75612 RepID=UPI00209FCA9E|nr:hypothetical protein [Pseudomonas mandelii]MCO8313921.1 hypothetical protein [Pseudomonas mandelii]